MKSHQIEKWIWTEDDFEQMGWHDSKIYAMHFDENIYFDIDYIFQWNTPEKQGILFTFWIAPATLIFRHPFGVKFSLESENGNAYHNGIEICDIVKKRSEHGDTWWHIETQQGYIDLEADSYTQIIRRTPTFQYGPCIDRTERGGISFSEEPNEKYKLDPTIIDQKKKDDTDYEIFLRKADIVFELHGLSNDSLGLKEFLKLKQSLKSELTMLNEKLRNTRFENSKISLPN